MSAGERFQIKNVEEFEYLVLKKHFKHNNNISFIR